MRSFLMTEYLRNNPHTHPFGVNVGVMTFARMDCNKLFLYALCSVPDRVQLGQIAEVSLLFM